jgi:hypothetical protein
MSVKLRSQASTVIFWLHEVTWSSICQAKMECDAKYILNTVAFPSMVLPVSEIRVQLCSALQDKNTKYLQ